MKSSNPSQTVYPCSACQSSDFRLASAGRKTFSTRCLSCGRVERRSLPVLRKHVFYLDQNVWSELYNVDSGERLSKAHGDFFKELHERLGRLVRLQQALLPYSDIHLDETAVFRKPTELALFIERFGGGARFVNSTTIELCQTLDGVVSFLGAETSGNIFAVDNALEDNRNEWLSPILITVERDYSGSAQMIRDERDRLFSAVLKLKSRWTKSSFKETLERELHGSVEDKRNAFLSSIEQQNQDDPMGAPAHLDPPIVDEVFSLRKVMLEAGVPPKLVWEKIIEFWGSHAYKALPHHRISSYLFAGVARKVALGGEKIINKGMMNDVRAIAAYAPYVDAMFIDKASEELLREKELKNDLAYKAQIFSLRTKVDFLAYLRSIEENTPQDVRECAVLFYG